MHDLQGERSRLADRSTWIVILSTSITAGFLNMASASMLQSSGIHEEPLALLSFLAVNVILATVAQLILWSIASAVLLRMGLNRSALAFSVGVGFIAIATLWPLLQSVDLTIGMKAYGVELAILSNVLLMTVLAYLVTRNASERLRSLGISLALSAPLIGGLLLAFVWSQLYLIQGTTSTASLISIAATGIAIPAILGLFVAFRGQVSALPFLATLALLVIAAPAIPAIASLGSSGETRPRAEAHVPSILVITVDTFRADALDLEDVAQSRTPALAALANQSVVFEQARAAAPWTKPSFASMFTGLSPLVHQVTQTTSRMPDEVESLAEKLRDHGYRTAAIGRNSFLHKNSNLHQGFDDYLMFPSSPGLSFGGKILGQLAPLRFGWPDPTSADLTDTALDWIRDHRNERPFMLWLHYFDPHIPYEPHVSLLDGAEPPGEMESSFDDLRGIRAGNTVLSTEEREWIRDLYDAEVRDVDANIGRVLDRMRELDLYDDALIVLTSDHGEEFWDHGHFEHGHDLYEEVVRVPLFFKLPGAKPALRVSENVTNMSLMATLLDVLGLLEPQRPLSADSLAGYWTPGAPPPQKSAHLSAGVLYYEEKVSLIFDGLKYIRNIQTGHEELFDLDKDPGERTSLVASMPDEVTRARELIEERTAISAEIRRSLNLPEESLLEPKDDWMRQLRSLGYVQ